MRPNDYIKKANELLAEIDGDRAGVPDYAYVELCFEIADMFTVAAQAKQAEIEQ